MFNMRELLFGDELGGEMAGMNFKHLITEIGLDSKDLLGVDKIEGNIDLENEQENEQRNNTRPNTNESERMNKAPQTSLKPISQSVQFSTQQVSNANNERSSKNKISIANKFTKKALAKQKDEVDELNFEAPVTQNTEEDLKLEVLAIENNEKVFCLSDLIIPTNKKLLRRIEKYNAMLLNNDNKAHDEGDKEHQDKEKQDKEELENLVQKAKNVQKFIKVNYTYNEKFFDKTFFLENYNENTSHFISTDPANAANTVLLDQSKQLQQQQPNQQSQFSQQNQFSFHQNVNNISNINGLRNLDYNDSNKELLLNEVMERDSPNSLLRIYHNEYRKSNINPYFSIFYNTKHFKNTFNHVIHDSVICHSFQPIQQKNKLFNNNFIVFPNKNDLFDEETLLAPMNFKTHCGAKDLEMLQYYEKRMLQSLNQIAEQVESLEEYKGSAFADFEEKIGDRLAKSRFERSAIENQFKKENYEEALAKDEDFDDNDDGEVGGEGGKNKVLDGCDSTLLLNKNLFPKVSQTNPMDSYAFNEDSPGQASEPKNLLLTREFNEKNNHLSLFGAIENSKVTTESSQETLLQPLVSLELEKSIKRLYNLKEDKLSNKRGDLSYSNSNNLALYDFLKQKRYNLPSKLNQEVSSGRFIHSILLDEEFFDDTRELNNCIKNYKLYSNKVFDLSDYNMVFEVPDKNAFPGKSNLPSSANNNNNNNNNVNSNGNGNTDAGNQANRKRSEDYGQLVNQNLFNAEGEQFSNFLRKTSLNSYNINPSNNQKLKIVKGKSNVITHAKCAYSLAYNKINLSMEELKHFHRPDFAKYLLNQKKKTKSNFRIQQGSSALLSSTEKASLKTKSWPVVIRSREFLREKERKRIQKNVQYMNAFEVFKNHFKLSLNEGKFALFEHIDENPLFINNFGMAFKLKRFLYTNKLFNCYNNPTVMSKLSESELRTLNLIGPNGIQIPLQPGQKLPLLGQLDSTDLKGLTIIDNKLFKAPVFYEKSKPLVFIQHSEQYHVNNQVIQQQNAFGGGSSSYNQGKALIGHGAPQQSTVSSGKDKEKGKHEHSRNNNNNIKIAIPKQEESLLNETTFADTALYAGSNDDPNNCSSINNNIIKLSTSAMQVAKSIPMKKNKKHHKNQRDSDSGNATIDPLTKHSKALEDPMKTKSTSPIENTIIVNSTNTGNSAIGRDNLSNKKETKRMQFLLVFKKKPENLSNTNRDSNDKQSANDVDLSEKFYIRELEHIYLTGQEEPKLEVYSPQAKQYQYFMKKKVHTYVDKIYEEVDFSAGINFKFFANLFPNITEQQLKKHFRELGIEIDKNICFYTPNKSVGQRNENKITPENICQFENCQYGQYKLKETGIKNLTNSDKISYATNKFINTIKDPKQQELAKVVEEKILTTPWNLTQNYLQAKLTNGMLSIKGIGDPSNGNGGYSFIKMPVKQYNTDNKTLKDQIDLLKEQNKNIKSVTGTDADLRKLPKSVLKMKLIQLGEDEEYVKKLTRWERVSLLRFKSSKAAELGYEGDITKYARGDRIGTSVQKETYQNNINEVFKTFIDYISNNDNYYRITPKSSANVSNILLPSSNAVNAASSHSKAKDNKGKDSSSIIKVGLVSESNNNEKPFQSHQIHDSSKILVNINTSLLGSSNNLSTTQGNTFHLELNLSNNHGKKSEVLNLKEDDEQDIANLETGYFEEPEENNVTLYDKSQHNGKLDKYNSGGISMSSALLRKRKKLSNRALKNDKLTKLYSKEGDECGTKIQLTMSTEDIELLRQKRKRNQGFDKFYEYDETTKNSTIRRRFQVGRRLNEILEDVVDGCIRYDKTKLFHYPVKKKDVPDYYEKIKNPIDLTTIKNKTKRNEYFSAQAFQDDLKLMLSNSTIYNGDESASQITRHARLIFDFAIEKLKAKKKEIEDEVDKLSLRMTQKTSMEPIVKTESTLNNISVSKFSVN